MSVLIMGMNLPKEDSVVIRVCSNGIVERDDKPLYKAVQVPSDDVTHGEWIKAEVVERDEISECHSPYWKCSVCGRAYVPYSASSFQFCPNCGAKME